MKSETLNSKRCTIKYTIHLILKLSRSMTPVYSTQLNTTKRSSRKSKKTSTSYGLKEVRRGSIRNSKSTKNESTPLLIPTRWSNKFYLNWNSNVKNSNKIGPISLILLKTDLMSLRRGSIKNSFTTLHKKNLTIGISPRIL